MICTVALLIRPGIILAAAEARPGVVGAPVPQRERFAFAFALFGQNLIYGLFLNFLMIFYTDVYGLSAAAVATLFLIARCWDACNDPLMGMLVDRTRTRWGKFRPYLLWTPLPIAVATVLCFTTFDVSPTVRLVLAYATYISWSMIYTVNDVPLWALSSAVTQDSSERTALITLARLLATMGILVPGIAVIPMVEFFGQGDDAKGYFYTASVFASIAAAFMLLAFFFVKERVPAAAAVPKMKDSYYALAANRPLQMIILMGLLAVFSMVAQSLFVYFATYNLGDRGLLPTLMLATAVAILLGTLPTPLLVRRLGKKGTMAALAWFKALASVAFFAVGFENLTLVYLMTVLTMLPVGAKSVLTTAMIADTIEYMQWKTGQRSEGIIFSVQTFMAKITTAIGGFIGGISLAVVGYVPNAVQSDSTLTAIFALVTLVPGITGLLILWPLRYYDLDEKRHQQILAELDARSTPTALPQTAQG